MRTDGTVIRVSKTSWPFADHEKVRLELVYGLKVSKGGRKPKTKAVFRNMSTPDKELALLEMDWLSLPRLTPGRIFGASPHFSDGKLDGNHIWVDIPSNQKVEVLTLQDAQAKLDNKTLLGAFGRDPFLPTTKVFHWIDKKGHEYWLPVFELMRKMFVRSPEMARSIIMYHGLDELIQDYSIHNKTLHISFTKHTKVGDIPLLSLIVSKPSLLRMWQSIAKHIPKASEWTTIDLPWLFDEDISIEATCKNNGTIHWIQEILDIKGIFTSFETIVPVHPNYVLRTIDGTMHPRKAHMSKPDTPDGCEASSKERPSEIILQSNDSPISRPKKYIHIQSTPLSVLNQLEISPNFIEMRDRPTVVTGKGNHSHSPDLSNTTQATYGHLADSISSSRSPTDAEEIGIGTKELKTAPQWNGLERFIEAINHAATILEGHPTLSWPIPAQALEKPKDAGSRWFLKLTNGASRSWCLANITFKARDYYFLEVGRDKDKRFSLSTIFIRYLNPGNLAYDWIKDMVTNNGHWNREKLAKSLPEIEFLPHKHILPPDWGAYFARKIHTS